MPNVVKTWEASERAFLGAVRLGAGAGAAVGLGSIPGLGTETPHVGQ